MNDDQQREVLMYIRAIVWGWSLGTLLVVGWLLVETIKMFGSP